MQLQRARKLCVITSGRMLLRLLRLNKTLRNNYVNNLLISLLLGVKALISLVTDTLYCAHTHALDCSKDELSSPVKFGQHCHITYILLAFYCISHMFNYLVTDFQRG